MQALVFKRYGRPDQVTFADIPRPVPQPDESLVQVHAVGLNPIDNMIPKGTFKPILRFQLPATLGSDVAGVVVEVGSRVTRFKPGDAVFASIFDLGTGALAEFAVVPANAAALKPAQLDFVQTASIPMVGLTSWQALKERAHLKPGHSVTIGSDFWKSDSFARWDADTPEGAPDDREPSRSDGDRRRPRNRSGDCAPFRPGWLLHGDARAKPGAARRARSRDCGMRAADLGHGMTASDAPAAAGKGLVRLHQKS
jgi:hypothetical protein